MSNKLQISPRLREIVDRELKPHEVIQWIGQPIPRFFTFQSTMGFLIGIPLTAHFLFLSWSATGFGSLSKQGLTPFDVLPILFYVPFIWMGVCMLLSPIWTRLMALQTVYLITDQRAISIEGEKRSTIRNYLPQQLQTVYRQENKDGTGDVIVTIRYIKDSEGGVRRELLGFMQLRDPKQVEHLLKTLADIEV